MKSMFLFVSMFAILQSPVFAKARTTATEITSADYFAPSRSDSSIRIPLSLGVPARTRYDGTGVALHAGMDFKITSSLPLFIGFETGFDLLGSHYGYYNYDYTYEGKTYLSVPVLLTSVFRFDLPKVPSLHPYAGVAVGPYFQITNGSGVVVEAMIRPGVSWNFAKGMELHGEPRFGIIGNSFTVQPTVGITFLN